MHECASEALPINVTDVMEEGASRTLIFGPSRPKRCRAGARKAVLALAGEGHPRAPPRENRPERTKKYVRTYRRHLTPLPCGSAKAGDGRNAAGS